MEYVFVFGNVEVVDWSRGGDKKPKQMKNI
jgi:hypothetical protein